MTKLLQNLNRKIRRTTPTVERRTNYLALYFCRSFYVFQYSSWEDGYDCFHNGVWCGYITRQQMGNIINSLGIVQEGV